MQTFIKVFLLSFCLNQIVYAGNELIFSVVSLDQATKRIINQNNKVLGAKTENMRGRKVHVIKVLTSDGRIQYLKVDAESGRIIR
jgi:uncharacterized membrane protein YkoI